MTSKKRARRIQSAMEDCFPGYGEYLQHVEGPPATPLARSFFLEDWSGFNAELDTLSRLEEVAVPRLLGFELYADSDDDESQQERRWGCFGAQLWPPSMLLGGLAELREVMDRMLAQSVEENALALWLLPDEATTRHRRMIILCRDCAQREELVWYFDGTLQRFWLNGQTIDTFLDRVIYSSAGDVPGPRELARALADEEWTAELGRRLSAQGLAPLTPAQVAVLADSLVTSNPIQRIFVSQAHQVGTDVLQEAQELLIEYCGSLRDFFKRQDRDIKEGLEEMARLHEKRLKGLRSDAEKMKMLADGAKTRADRLDSENRELRKGLAAADKAPPSNSSADPPAHDDAQWGGLVRSALDALF